MPFTFSHPAIVLPLNYLNKKYFSLTGLVMGSIVPDCKFFIKNSFIRNCSHNWWGVFWLDMPLGILLCFLFHDVARNPLLCNSTHFFYSRLMQFEKFDWNKCFRQKWFVVITSVIIGSLSHLIWDRLTHRSYYFLSFIPGFQSNTYLTCHPALVYRLFQGIYSLVGLIVLLFAIRQLPAERASACHKGSVGFGLGIGGISIIIYLINATHRNYAYIEEILGSAISSFIFALLAMSIIVSVKNAIIKKAR